jgi:hypothetical protein
MHSAAIRRSFPKPQVQASIGAEPFQVRMPRGPFLPS